jgi:hypothetical protein
MSVDDLLLAIIIGGTMLSGAYLRAQYAARRSYRIAERSNELRLRELYGTRSNTRGSPQDPERRVPQTAVTRTPRNAEPGAMVLRNPVQAQVAARQTDAVWEPDARHAQLITSAKYAGNQNPSIG